MIHRRTLLALSATSLFIPTASRAAVPGSTAVLWETLAAARRREAKRDDDEAVAEESMVEDIIARLTAAGAQTAQAFQSGFSDAMRRAYRWDLWGAGYVIHGGLSDDGFAYFRAWLIAQGQEAFEQALADPDRLAVLVPANRQEPLELESLLYAGATAWEAATGQSPNGPQWQSSDLTGAEPAGRPFDEATLADRYPRLTARFGSAPLG